MAQKATKAKETLNNYVMRIAAEASKGYTLANKKTMNEALSNFNERLRTGTSDKEMQDALATLKDKSVAEPINSFRGFKAVDMIQSIENMLEV